MIDWIKYRWNLRNFNKKLVKMSAEIPIDENHGSYLAQKEDEFENGIKYYQTHYYARICEKLVLPMPEQNRGDYYTDFDDEEGAKKILTTKGFKYVRDLIHQEQKLRRESWFFWVTISFGLIGVLTGLISVYKN